MLTVENIETAGWGPALRGMRNPLDSWGKADSTFAQVTWLADSPTLIYELGDNDRDLMKRLIHAGGNEHCKFRRMLAVWCDVNAPLYWWKQFGTYRVGTVMNSCSTMHTLGKKPFDIDMFSNDQLLPGGKEELELTINNLNESRRLWLMHREYAKEYEVSNIQLAKDHADKAKTWWYSMIQILPTSFNQRRTVMMNYEVMAGIYRQRRAHKLKEWHDFIDVMVENLPHPWIFTGEE